MLISEKDIRKGKNKGKHKGTVKFSAAPLLIAEAMKPKEKSKAQLDHELELARLREERKDKNREGRRKFFGNIKSGAKKTGSWLMSDEPVFQTTDNTDDYDGVNLFEDYENIPSEVQAILDKHEQSFIDGDYSGLTKAHNELSEIGYTFEFGLDGQAYDLRKIGEKGKTESSIEKQNNEPTSNQIIQQENVVDEEKLNVKDEEGDEYDYKFVGEIIVNEFEYNGLKVKVAEILDGYYGVTNNKEPFVDAPKRYSSPEIAEQKVKDYIDDLLWEAGLDSSEEREDDEHPEETAIVNVIGEDRDEQEIVYEGIHIPMNWALRNDSDLLNYLVVRNKISKKDYFALMKSGDYEIERMEQTVTVGVKKVCAFSMLFHCDVE